MKLFKVFMASAALLFIGMGASAQDYNRVTFGYTPMTWVTTSGNSSESDSIEGLTLGYTHGFSILDSMPLFVEVGGSVKFNNTSESTVIVGGSTLSEYTTTFLSLVVPVSLTYKIPVAGKLSIAPYAGVQGKYNILGQSKQSGDLVGDVTVNIFDHDGKHFQMGYQAGVNVNLSRFVIGAGYQGDFMELAPNTKTHGYLVYLGYDF